MFPWQVFGLCRLNPTRRTSQCLFGTSVILGFRTCLPLRGSPGFSPDSLLILLAEKPWRKPPYLVLLFSASPLGVDILLKRSP
jgi:hypothetical protein